MARKRFERNRNAASARRRRPIWEILESRILLTAFVTNDLAGTWYLSGIASEGTVQINSAGLITGGLLSHIDADPAAPSGTLSITSGGLVTLDSTQIKYGAMSSVKDIFALSDSTDQTGHSLDIGVRPLSSNFSNSDLTGTWTVTFDGDSSDSSGFGTITFDGNGNITAGSTTDGSDANVPITGGSYTVNQDSTVSLIVDTGGDSFTGVGAMNASKDFLAFNPPPDQFGDAASAGSSLLFTLVRSSGAYTNADAAGTWDISGTAATGFVSLDSAGRIVGGQLITPGGIAAVTGTYTLSASGALHVNAISTGPDGTDTTVFSGSMNASKDAVVMNTTSSGSDMTVLLKNATTVNHLPTLTSVTAFSGATGGTPFDITFAQLKAASNAADSDGNTIQFQVQSLGTSQGGDFTLNGDPVGSAPFIFSAGDTLEWMPSAGASGAVPVISVRAFDGLGVSATSIPVIVNTSISTPVVFNDDAANDTWNLVGTGVQGAVELDDAGGISDGSLTTDTNTTFTPSGSYTLNSDGTFSLSVDTPGTNTSGAMNRTQDVIALSNTSSSHSLGLLLRHSEDNFSNADLLGTWTIEFTGNDAGENGSGTVVADGQGNFTGTLKTGTGTQSITGTYSVAPDGSVTVSPSDSDDFIGNINASKDVVALDRADLSVDETRTMVLIRSSGAYSNADLLGSWVIAADGSTGVMSFDGAGHISGTQTNAQGNFTLGGTYTVSAAGAVTGNLTLTQGSSVSHLTFTGAMNVNRNLMAVNSVSASSADDLVVLVGNGNHTPTFTALTALGTATAGHPFTFHYHDLLATSNAADADGDPISFKVTSIASGTLTINGTPVSSFPATVTSDDTLVWTPAASASGNVTAFSITASDGTAASATPVAVVIKTVTTPIISITANKPKASEINGTASGMGQFTLTRSGGTIGAPLDVTVVLSGTATNGVDFTTIPTEIHFNASSSTATVNVKPLTDVLAEGTETVILTVVGSDEDAIYNINPLKSAGTVSIADAASTISVAVSKPKASEINGSTTGMGQFTLTRTGGDLSVQQTVTFALTGTADATHFTIPNSVTFNATTGTGTVVFAPGQKTATVPFSPSNDGVADAPALNVTLTVTPDNATASYLLGAVSHATINIADAAATISVAVSKAKASEINGTSSGMGQFTLTRTGLNITGTQTVDFSISGTATDPANFTIPNSATVHYNATAGTGTVQFVGSAKTVTVPFLVVNDGLADSPVLSVTLAVTADNAPSTYFTGTPGRATINIIDAAPTVSVTASPAAPIINGSVSRLGQFVVARKGLDLTTTQVIDFTLTGSAVDLSNFAVVNSSAVSMTTASTGQITLSPGQKSGTLTVTPVDHAAANGTADGLIFTLVADAGPTYFIDPLLSAAAGDRTSTFTTSVTKAHATELNGSTSGMGQFTVTRKGGDLSRQVTVDFTLGGDTLGFGVADVNYHVLTTPNVLTFNASTGTGTLVFQAGQTSLNIPFNSINDLKMDLPASQGGPDAHLLVSQDDAHTFLVNPAKATADIIIADAASKVSGFVTKQASEINGTASGMGVFTLVRSGGDLNLPLTVNYNLGGSATEGSDYATIANHSVTFAPGKTTATVDIQPIDDLTNESNETVQLVLQPDLTFSYFIDIANATPTMTIADDNRLITFGPVNNITGAVHGTPLNITFNDFVTATNAQVPLGGTLTFKVTQVLKGTLKKNGANVVPNTTTVATGESLDYTALAAGTTKAFNIVALNGTNASAAITITVQAT